jgi:hypothetical protein
VRSSSRKLAGPASLLIGALAVLSVWLPVLSYYAIPQVAVTEPDVAAARSTPSNAVLAEVGDFNLLSVAEQRPDVAVGVAESILEGRLELPNLPDAPIRIPFSPDDLDGLPADLQLSFAGWIVPDMLLSAYEQTGRESFFAMARDVVEAWDNYERSARLPKGFLWNDHAISARVRVLAEFWRLYRQRSDYTPSEGRAVLEQAARYRALLADPARFTFATNHGLMQNLGLLELVLAFPSLPDGGHYRRLAMERVGQQLAFLIDDQGVIRENSAGYQSFGLELLAMTFRCLTLLDVPVPPDWQQKYERGLVFLASLQRPDGTLPATGDTDGGAQPGTPEVTDIDPTGLSGPLHPMAPTKPATPVTVGLAAGYWIDWDGLDSWPTPQDLSQTIVTWTRPPSPSHKHADELSVLLWSRGVSWLTSVGYWPYAAQGGAAASSWTGANAPHLSSEPADSARTAALVASGLAGRVAAVDLERRGPGAYYARRQVVRLGTGLWLIVDHVRSDSVAANETIWTIGPGISLEAGASSGSYRLQASAGAASASLALAGSAGTVLEHYRGSETPFAGWHVVGSVPQPVPAIVVEQPAGEAWSVLVLSTATAEAPPAKVDGAVTMSPGSSADTWTIMLPISSGPLTVTRSDASIKVSGLPAADGTSGTVDLVPAPDPAPAVSQIASAFAQAAADYPVFQERTSARVRVTVVLMTMLLAQEIVFFAVRRWRRAFVTRLRLASVIAWVGIASAIQIAILPSWAVLAVA